MSHAKFGPDRFSRFDVYWIQTNKQSNKKQTGKQSIYIFIKNIFRTVYTFWSFSFFPLYSRHFDQFPFPPSDVIYNPFIRNFKWPSYRISIYRWSKNSLFFFCRNPQKRLSRVKTLSTANNFTSRPTIELLSVRELQKTNILKTRFRLNIFDNNFSFFLCVIFA